MQKDGYKPRVLILDIETQPHEVYAWDLWNTNIGAHMMKKPSRIICFSAKWLNQPKVIFHQRTGSGVKMLRAIRKLLNDADFVIHFNGKKFDIKRIFNELLEHEIEPPSTFFHIDIYVALRRTFDFPYKSLDYICKVLKVPGKFSHKGFQLWKDVMAGDEKAKADMRAYNINDIVITENVFHRLRNWLPITSGYKRICEYLNGKRKIPK